MTRPSSTAAPMRGTARIPCPGEAATTAFSCFRFT
jgi:hypothetical protein